MSARTAKRKGGKRAPAQSRGLVPQALKDGAGSDGEVFEFLTKIAGLVHPGVNNLEELDPKDQKTWIRFREAAIRGHHSLADLVKTLGEALSLQAAAQIEDLRERREAELEERKGRASSALEDQGQRREERKAKLGQELRERETKRINESRRDNLVLAMTAFSFLVATVLATVWLVSGQQVALAVSGFWTACSAVGARRLFLPPPPEPGKQGQRPPRGRERVAAKLDPG